MTYKYETREGKPMIVALPEMEKPKAADHYKYEHLPSLDEALIAYNKHIANLPKYPMLEPYPLFEGRKDLVLNTHFVVKDYGYAGKYAEPIKQTICPQTMKMCEMSYFQCNTVCYITQQENNNHNPNLITAIPLPQSKPVNKTSWNVIQNDGEVLASFKEESWAIEWRDKYSATSEVRMIKDDFSKVPPISESDYKWMMLNKPLGKQ